MLGQHVLVTAELARVAIGAAEDLRPPGDNVIAVLLAHAAREERREQFVSLDAVVERIDQALDGVVAAGPLVERRRVPGLAHRIHTSRR